MTVAEFNSPLFALAALITGKVDKDSLSPESAETLSDVALEHGLGPMLAWTIEQAGLDVDEPGWTKIMASARQESARYLIRRAAQAELHIALEAAGILAIWLKGFALAHTVYPAPTLRPMSDLDLMVPYNLRRQSLAIASKLGYHAYQPEMFRGYLDLTHHYPLSGYVNDAIHLEIHFRLLGWADTLLLPQHLKWFFEQIQVYTWQDLAFTSLTAEAHLLYLCAHAVLQHGEVDFSLGRYFDIHRLIQQNPALDWVVVLDKARAFNWIYAVDVALKLSQEYFQTPIPDQFLRQLQTGEPDLKIIEYARRSPPTSRWEHNLSQFESLSWRSRVRLALGLVFPSTDYMRWRYNASAWELPFLYPYRWLSIGQDALKTRLEKSG